MASHFWGAILVHCFQTIFLDFLLGDWAFGPGKRMEIRRRVAARQQVQLHFWAKFIKFHFGDDGSNSNCLYCAHKKKDRADKAARPEFREESPPGDVKTGIQPRPTELFFYFLNSKASRNTGLPFLFGRFLDYCFDNGHLP